jgi:hypothetical protein
LVVAAVPEVFCFWQLTDKSLFSLGWYTYLFLLPDLAEEVV